MSPDVATPYSMLIGRLSRLAHIEPAREPRSNGSHYRPIRCVTFLQHHRDLRRHNWPNRLSREDGIEAEDEHDAADAVAGAPVYVHESGPAHSGQREGIWGVTTMSRERVLFHCCFWP